LQIRKMEKAPRRVVVVETAFIGDVVFTSPLVHAIKEAYSESEVYMLVRPYSVEVAACIPGVDKVLTFDKYGSESGPVGILKAARRIRREKCDLLVSPHRSTRSALLARFSGVPLRVGHRQGLGRLTYNVSVPPLPNQNCGLLQNLNLLAAVGIESCGTRLRLKGPADQDEYIEGFCNLNGIRPEDKMVALCIGAFWPTKRWPAVYYASLGESLTERGYQPVLFGGPNELGIATEIMKARAQPLASCLGNRLVESAALMARCEMAVGGDSGLAHMARALGLPTVLIYGPTDPKAHRFEENSRVLTANVKCRPCSPHGPRRCPERHHDCMRMVSPENVLDALREIADLQTPLPGHERHARERPDATPPPG